MSFLNFFKKALIICVVSASIISITPAVASAQVQDHEPGITDSIYRLYVSVFDREPDDSGFEYWVDTYVSGVSLEEIAGYFVSSSEWETRYGDVDDVEYVHVLYKNVLDRSPDTKGGAYWMNQLASGLERQEMLVYFSEGKELIQKTKTSDPVAPEAAIPANSGEGRRIIYSNDKQRVWMVNQDNSLHDTYLVSGRDNTPLKGTYSVFSKSRNAWAGHDGITMEYMVRFTYGRTLAIGFHAIPRYSDGTPMQTEEELGTFQSAGCVRQSDHKAAALYAWADVGTTVVVID